MSKALLISGLNGTAAFWNNVQKNLVSDHAVLAYDQPGCGGRAAGKAKVSIESLALDALDVADSAFGEEPLIIVGHSTGGAIAQMVAVQAPHRVRRLVLSGAWLRSDAYMREMFGFRRNIIHRAHDLLKPLMALLRLQPSEVRDGSLSPEPLSDEEASTLLSRMDALLAFRGDELATHIQAPTLVLGVNDDRVIPPSHQQELNDAIVGSDLEFLREGGHFFPVTQAVRYCELIRGWLSERQEGVDG